MPNRKIYTSSEVKIGQALAAAVITQVNVLTAVTSATFTQDTPREQVMAFGKSGQIATVQTESTTSTIEVVFHPYDDTDTPTGGGVDNDEPYFSPDELNKLMADSGADNPTGVTVLVAGVGKLTSALLTSITAEGSVGALPSITLGFDGTGSTDEDNVTPAAASYDIATMSEIHLFAADNYPLTADTSYAQTATFNWEMPTERLNRLGNSLESAQTYGTPPGTASISVEGTENPDTITTVRIGEWVFNLDADSKISNTTRNLAVGEIGQTYNITVEGVADGCTALSHGPE